MTLSREFRFYSDDDPVSERTRWVLGHVYELDNARIERILSDPRRRILMRIDEAGQLAGFVVFNDYKQQLLMPQNAFINPEDKELVASDSLAVYSFEQVWWRDEAFNFERIVREVFAAMSEALTAGYKRHALVGLLDDRAQNEPLRAVLLDLGFRPRPNAYRDYRLPLVTLPLVEEIRFEEADEFSVHTFEDPPGPAQMALTFNRVFAGGRPAIDAEFIEGMCEGPLFSRALSLWIGRGEQVAGFSWVERPAAHLADLQLLGTDPDFRRKGLVSRCLPVFMRTCQAQGIDTLAFSIESHNRAPSAMVDALGLKPFQTRNLLMRVR